MSHSFTAGFAHFVFSTKDRLPIIPSDTERLYSYAGGIIRSENCSLLESGGMPDHVHLLVKVHPSASYADLMRVVKARTSAWMKETYPSLRDFAWQSGYGGFSVSKSNVDAVRRYIADQAEHHKTRTFQEEFIALLEKHGVEYNPEYVWQ